MPVGVLAADKVSRISEFKRRKSRFELKRVPTDEVPDYEARGWEISSRLKRGVRVKKQKPEDEQLENDFWIILYRFGYKQLNIGRRFEIEITQSQGKIIRKQVDVFALDDETVVIAECKSSGVRRKRALQNDIGEFEANKGPIARALRSHFGEPFNRKIIWAFVTRNID